MTHHHTVVFYMGDFSLFVCLFFSLSVSLGALTCATQKDKDLGTL